MPVHSIHGLSEEAFGHWLAGFADGEGSFAIYHHARGGNYACQFQAKLRADDRAVLEAVQERLGVGRIYHERRSGASRPCVAWRVSDRPGCLALVELFDRYPLQAKKQRDYLIWRQAVMAWVSRRPAKWSRWGRRDDGDGWATMAELKAALEAGRKYKEFTT